jgi:hypothetical protein
MKAALFYALIVAKSVCEAATQQQLINIQDMLVLEQKALLIKAGRIKASGVQLPLEVYNNYVPIVFVNNTGLAASQVYVTFQGVNVASPGPQQFLTFDPNSALGSFVTPSNTLLSANYSFPLSAVPQVLGLSNSYLFYIPLTASGRAYVTFNQPLFVAVSSTAPYGVLDPYVTKYSDPNYYTIYDKWEFTFTASGNTAPNLGWQGNINTSGVDFFGISSELSFLSYPSGNLLQTFDPTQVNDGPTSFTKARNTLLTTFATGLNGAHNANAWSTLPLAFLSNPYDAMSSVTTYLRVLNPGFSIQNPPTSYAGSVPFYQNPAQGFPADYLQNAASYEENYIDKWFSYYNSMTPLLTIFQDVLAAPFTYSGHSTGASPTQTFTLNPTPASGPVETLTQAAGFTTPFFTGTGLPFMPANAILSQYIGGTFEVGLFNYTLMPTISQTNLRANSTSYYSNPPFMTTAGPWYDLYAYLLHSQAVIPSYSTTQIGAVYASPYDDLLGINSSIAVKNPTDTSTTPTPFVNIALNAGNTLPNIADAGSIQVTFHLNVPSSLISYRSGTSGNYISITSGTPVTINSFPLQVNYVSGNTPSVQRYYTLYLKYQNMQPTVTSANQYTDIDQGIIQTTTIYPTDNTATAFDITFVQ